MKCNLCEESLYCPVHDPEMYERTDTMMTRDEMVAAMIKEKYPDGEKMCTTCRQFLPVSMFHVSWSGGKPRLNSCCKTCKKFEPAQRMKRGFG